MPYVHVDIIVVAADDGRRRYRDLPDTGGLLPNKFPVLDLRRVHAAVPGHEL